MAETRTLTGSLLGCFMSSVYTALFFLSSFRPRYQPVQIDAGLFEVFRPAALVRGAEDVFYDVAFQKGQAVFLYEVQRLYGEAAVMGRGEGIVLLLQLFIFGCRTPQIAAGAGVAGVIF